MNTRNRMLAMGAGALAAALIMSAPVMAAEGKGARGIHTGGEHLIKVAGGHRGHGVRKDFYPHRRGHGAHRGRGYGPRSLHRHYRHGHRGHFKGHYKRGSRQWRGHRYWYRHRPYHRGHRYWWHPRYGKYYGYGYGRLGHGAHSVIRIY